MNYNLYDQGLVATLENLQDTALRAVCLQKAKKGCLGAAECKCPAAYHLGYFTWYCEVHGSVTSNEFETMVDIQYQYHLLSEEQVKKYLQKYDTKYKVGRDVFF